MRLVVAMAANVKGRTTMRITADILKALDKAVQEAGSEAALAKRCGFPQSQLSRIRKRKTPTVRDATAEKLHPVLAKYLGDVASGPSHAVLSDDEKRYLAMYRAIPANARHRVREIVESMFVQILFGG